MEDKWLGKISSAKFGYGGYQDAMMGAWFSLSGDGLGIQDGKGMWASKPGVGAKWTEEDQIKEWGLMVKYVLDLMRQAKVKNFKDLVGIPVEVELDGNMLKSWRILTEVL